MHVTLICCPFKTSFGWYASSLKAAIEKRTGHKVQWVASNCGCGTPMAQARRFQVPREQYDYFEMLIPGDVAKQTWERPLRLAARVVFTYLKARRYARLSRDAEVVHFHQILNAYGAKTLFHWLNQPSTATRIVTVHELDRYQLEDPKRNRAYNRADGIIVHCEDMKQQLVQLNVPEDKIHIVLHGTDLPVPSPGNGREGIVFYGGHYLTHGKGVETAFKAMRIIKQRMGTNAPKLTIHGQYGMDLKEEAVQLAESIGVANDTMWLDDIPEEDALRLYQHSQVCVLPFTASFAGLAASLAAACELPVVATRKAGLPDHLGDAGVWIEENNPEQLASKTMELLSDSRLSQEIGSRLRKRAEEHLSWERIADRTLQVYEQSMKKKTAAAPSLGWGRRERAIVEGHGDS